MKLGARILKTGTAIVLALFLAELLKLPSPVFAGIAAIFAVQPSIYRSYLTIVEQIQGNIIGALCAILFYQLFGNHFVIIGLAAIIAIIIHLRLKIENTISLSLVTLVAIMVAPEDDFYSFAFIRFITILLGILSAFLINLALLPPKYETKLFKSIMEITGEVIKWIRISIYQASDHVELKNDIERIKERLIRLDQIFLFYKEERNFLRKHRYAKMRKVVLYRHMIATVRASLNVLKKLHQYENDLSLLPGHFTEKLKGCIEQLTISHEQILIRYTGKAKTKHEEKIGELDSMKQSLLKLHLQCLKEEGDEQAAYHILQMMAAVMEYNEHLLHLEKLINSLQSFHKDEGHVRLAEPDPQ
ncbi:MAG: hypothetical protein C6P37_16125 [Caldibacillus debilis]|uniref:Aromatic acid exporter family protein n=1 Tax=Caldibacillus debilis TaxID=301148 RepID=A0A3E0JWW7_9BACI|nr:aromatic acid exporter family protein [Caldibacillus debilis]REJ24375.1 MAG: hypothetical protein C6P37_16125 [Caldibacillus debilis]